MRTRRLHARLCARLGKVFGARLVKAFGARPHPATKKSARQLAARQRVLFCEKMNIDPEKMNLGTKEWQQKRAEWQPTAHASLARFICRFKVNF